LLRAAAEVMRVMIVIQPAAKPVNGPNASRAYR
jgi:hypothetical protein